MLYSASPSVKICFLIKDSWFNHAVCQSAHQGLSGSVVVLLNSCEETEVHKVVLKQDFWIHLLKEHFCFSLFTLAVWMSVTVSVRDFVQWEPGPSPCSSHLSICVNVLLPGKQHIWSPLHLKIRNLQMPLKVMQLTNGILGWRTAANTDHEEDVNCFTLHAVTSVFCVFVSFE